jgi:hypothetical protein
MADNLEALLEELRIAADEIVEMPNALLSIAMGTEPWDLVRRIDRLDMRLPALRCLVDIREIAKALARAPAWDVATVSMITKAAESNPSKQNLQALEVLFNLTEQGLEEVALTLKDTALANVPVTICAVEACRRAAAVYRQLQIVDGGPLFGPACYPRSSITEVE